MIAPTKAGITLNQMDPTQKTAGKVITTLSQMVKWLRTNGFMTELIKLGIILSPMAPMLKQLAR